LPTFNKYIYVLIHQTQPNIKHLLNKNKHLFIGTARQSVQQVSNQNKGFEDRLFKKHGRWKTDRAKDGYAKENIVERVSVTKQLSI
jgi:hypothetical protein